MSSPMSGKPAFAKALRPSRVAGDEYRHAVHERNARLERAFRVEARRFLGTDRQVVQHHFGARRAQRRDDVVVVGFGYGRANERLMIRIVLEMLGETVEDAPHAHLDAARRQVVAEHRGAIGQREDGFVDVASDFARVDVERGDDVEVRRTVVADPPMHQARPRFQASCHA